MCLRREKNATNLITLPCECKIFVHCMKQIKWFYIIWMCWVQKWSRFLYQVWVLCKTVIMIFIVLQIFFKITLIAFGMLLKILVSFGSLLPTNFLTTCPKACHAVFSVAFTVLSNVASDKVSWYGDPWICFCKSWKFFENVFYHSKLDVKRGQIYFTKSDKNWMRNIFRTDDHLVSRRPVLLDPLTTSCPTVPL